MRFAYLSEKVVLSHISKPLLLSDIHLRTGVRKFGSFYCTLEKFGELCRPVATKTSTSFAIDPENHHDNLQPLSEFIQRNADAIWDGDWRLVDFIRHTPAKIWRFYATAIRCPSLFKRGRANARLNQTLPTQEWPLNPSECPEDILSVTPSEFKFALRVYCTIERLLYCSSNARTLGPVTITTSIAALPNTTFSFHTLLNRMAFASSHAAMIKWRKETVAERREKGPFQSLREDALVSIQVDNINLRAGHSLSVHGQSYFGFDGLATQALNSNIHFDVRAYIQNVAPEDRLPMYPEFSSRKQYIETNFPKASDDPDIIGFGYLALGVAISMKGLIATRDSHNQMSYRRAMLQSLKGRTGGRARIEYIDIKRCNANDIFEVEKIVEMVERKFNPPEAKEHVMVAMVGDQPVFRMLFNIWLSSYVKKTRRCHWMVPLPGQFHVDKQGLIPTVKKYLSGSGLEELLQFTGLSDKHQINFMSLSHYRKNRRVLSQITAALIIRMNKALAEYKPDLGIEICELLENIEAFSHLNMSEQVRVSMKEDFTTKFKDILPNGCRLEVSETVHPSVLLIGKKISDAILEISQHSTNMLFFGKIQLLSVLIPWSAYNLLIRRGQTHIVEKFYDAFLGLLHGTMKLNYQENVVFYNFMRRVMALAAKHVLFEAGHLVANLHDSATHTNLALDETMESCMIRDSKIWCTNNPKLLEESPAFSTIVTKIIQTSQEQLRTSFTKKGLNCDVGECEHELDLMKRGESSSAPSGGTVYKRSNYFDRERKTSVNVAEMVDYLEKRAYYGESHISCAYILNPLPEPRRIIKTAGFAEQLVGAESQGRFAACLHMGTKLHEVFVQDPLTDEDRVKYFDSKPFHSILNHWNKKWLFKSMSQADPSIRIEKLVERKDKEATARLIRSMNRRRERVTSVKSRLLDLYRECTYAGESHGTRMQDLHRLHEEVIRNGHILSPKAFAFRRNVIANEPYYRPSLTFYQELQDLKVMSEAKVCFLNTSSVIPEEMSSSLSVLHLDVTSSVPHNPSTSVINLSIRDAVREKALSFVTPFVSSLQYSGVTDIHFHVDVPGEAPVGYNIVRYPRNKTVMESGAEEDANEASESQDFICLSSAYDRPWPVILEREQNRHFLYSMYTLECARVSIMIKSERGDDSENNVDNNGDYNAFVHGVPVVMSGSARCAKLSSLRFERYSRGPHIFVSGFQHDSLSPQTEAASAMSARQDEAVRHLMMEMSASVPDSNELRNLVVYDSTCCWELTTSGMRRYPAGDSNHALSVTRIPFIIQHVSVDRCIYRRRNEQSSGSTGNNTEECHAGSRYVCSSVDTRKNVNVLNLPQEQDNSRITIAVRNAQTELPLLLLFSGLTVNFNIICTSEESYIDVAMLGDALRMAKFDVNDLAMLYCLSGSDHTPHTRGVTNAMFFESYRELKECNAINTGHLYSPEVIGDIIESSLQPSKWVDSEKVYAGAFLKAMIHKKGSISNSSFNLTTGIFTSGSFPHECVRENNNAWAHAIRNLISRQELDNPAMYLPEKMDIELQFRRSVYWNHIWHQCSQEEVVGIREAGHSFQFGYDNKGLVIFEDAEDARRRERVLRQPVVRLCNCKSSKNTCGTRQCGCLSRGLSCIFCQCPSTCVNKGINVLHTINSNNGSDAKPDHPVSVNRAVNMDVGVSAMEVGDQTEREHGHSEIHEAEDMSTLIETDQGARVGNSAMSPISNSFFNEAALGPTECELISLEQIQHSLRNDSSDDESDGYLSDEE